MKRVFSAIIVKNVKDEILWLKRSDSDPDDSGQWSLPAGERELGETGTEAAKRELFEETGLEAENLTHAHSLERENWSVEFYVSQTADYESIQISDEFSEFGFFALDATPQNIVYDAYWGVLLALRSELVQRPSQLVEAILTSLFYTHLAKDLEKFSQLHTYRYMKHIILSTPNRKFKSVLPFLLSHCPKERREIFLLGELFFAYFTLHDDLCDGLLERYKVPTIRSIFGEHRAVSALALMPTDLKYAAKLCGLESINASELVKTICSKQFRRFHGKYDKLDSYLADSYARTNFLEEIWVSAIGTSGNTLAARFIKEHYRDFAQLGQMANDLMDMGYVRSGVESAKGVDCDTERGIYSSNLVLSEMGIDDADKRPYLLDEMARMREGVITSINGLGEIESKVTSLWFRSQFLKWEFDEDPGAYEMIFDCMRTIDKLQVGLK